MTLPYGSYPNLPSLSPIAGLKVLLEGGEAFPRFTDPPKKKALGGENQAEPWYTPPTGFLDLVVFDGLPPEIVEAFRGELDRLADVTEALPSTMRDFEAHGMLPGQTWLIGLRKPVVSMEKVGESLNLVCLPPGVALRDGDQVALSSIWNLKREMNELGMSRRITAVTFAVRLTILEIMQLAPAMARENRVYVGHVAG